ncbi:MAG: hypothetical protein ACXWKP_24980, partial [Bradyrhizobium sp.]
MNSEFIEAINSTADTSFDASVPTNTDASVPIKWNGEPVKCPVVLNLLAHPRFFTRRSGIATTGFLDGERKLDGAPFKVTTTCPEYLGQPSGRVPNAEEKRGAWPLQEEYLVGRLGKNEEENCRNWNTGKWIDRLIRTATTPAEAVEGLNLITGRWEEYFNPGEIFDSVSEDDGVIEAPFGREGFRFNIDRRDKERLALKLSDNDWLALRDYFEECDDVAKIDINELAGTSDPLAERIDFPDALDRAEAGKIIRILMLGMRSLWHPVIRAITGHATMTSLGKTQGVGDKVAAAVGRSRVIEGLRIAESIRKGLKKQSVRKGLKKQDRVFSTWLNQVRAGQTVVHRPGFSVDDVIKGTLAVLMADKSLPTPVRTGGHHWPVFKLADMPLAANDNLRSDDADRKAA